MRRGYVVGMAAAVWLVSCLPAQAVVLRYRPKAGAVVKHKVSISGRVDATVSGGGGTEGGMSVEMQGTVDYAEKAVSQTEGTTRVENRVVGGKMTMSMAGESQSAPVPSGRMVVDVDPRGRVVKLVEATFGDQTLTKGMPSAGFESILGWYQFAAFAEGEVEVDDTWTDEIRTPGEEGMPEMALQIKSQLLALTTYQERKCAKIRTSFEGPMSFDLSEVAPPEEEVEGTMEAVLQGDMVWYYDYENSVHVYAEGAVGMNKTMTMSGPDTPGGIMDMNMVMNVKYALAQ